VIYQSGLRDVSYVANLYWVHILGSMVSKVKNRERRVVAMDETRLQGREVFIWAAIDIDKKEFLSLYASYQRSSINQHDDICQEGPGCVHQRARGPCGRGSVVSMGP
jgi:hypothetical protein